MYMDSHGGHEHGFTRILVNRDLQAESGCEGQETRWEGGKVKHKTHTGVPEQEQAVQIELPQWLHHP